MAELEHSIGDVARIVGIKIPTIRYYEQIGLLCDVGRSEGNRRSYGAGDLRRLAFIRHARELGFPMDEIRTLLKLQDDPDQPCAAADAIATARLQDVEHRIARLERLRGELRKMVEQCAAGRVGECRVIETLADPTHTHGRLADE